MDYQKLLPALAITLGLSASAAQSFAAGQHSDLFGMTELQSNGTLLSLAKDSGCIPGKDGNKHCLAGGRACVSSPGKLKHKAKDADKQCNGEKSCAGSKDAEKQCKGDKSCSGEKSCKGEKSCAGEKSCKGAKSESSCAGKKSSALDHTCASNR